jgi:hypothetical protein
MDAAAEPTPATAGVRKHERPPPPELDAAVQAAVDDIMNGRTRDSAAEWLQREYVRLMKREARLRARGGTLDPDA